jgi:hypothetical protein
VQEERSLVWIVVAVDVLSCGRDKGGQGAGLCEREQ